VLGVLDESFRVAEEGVGRESKREWHTQLAPSPSHRGIDHRAHFHLHQSSNADANMSPLVKLKVSGS